ncbi:MAG: DNA-processing protein DprA [Lentisphaeria bacterium]|nr:DNA-processing protein DprA [Lentisphaeria bacterium]
MNDHDGCIVLNMLSGIGGSRANALIEFCGSVSAIFESDAASLSRIRGISENLADRILSWRDHVELDRELEIARNGGVTILCRTDDEYPAALRELRDAPLCIYIRGALPPDLSTRSLSMVGTRNASNYGARMARHLAEAAAFGGWTTISGLAVGIDTIVHQATVDAGGKTVAVLGGGLAKLHPVENLDLARAIIRTGGAVISEFPMTTVPTRHTFPMRNRIIAGLSCGTLVVEAGVNSGSLITAAQALEQGRHVFAVPGEADNPSAAGCNTLIKQGAKLVMNFDDVLDEFDFLPGFHPSELHESPAAFNVSSDGEAADETDDSMFSDDEKAILDALKSGPANVDAISESTGVAPSVVISTMIGLEILHRVRKNPDGTYSKKR